MITDDILNEIATGSTPDGSAKLPESPSRTKAVSSSFIWENEEGEGGVNFAEIEDALRTDGGGGGEDD